MPNFEFTDLTGKARSLAEFRGKYLLVDFWGVWCVDCRRETPFQVEAYKRFRSRGFEILGLDWDDKIETVTDYMTKTGITWTQARKDSILELTEVRYRIYEYPSTLLLGPDGKVIVIEQEKLQGEELSKTLEGDCEIDPKSESKAKVQVWEVGKERTTRQPKRRHPLFLMMVVF